MIKARIKYGAILLWAFDTALFLYIFAQVAKHVKLVFY